MDSNSEIQGYKVYPMLHFRRKFSSSITMDSNPLTQSGKVKSPFCVSKARWAPSTSFWEIVETARRSAAADSRSNLITKSLFPCL